MAVKQLAPISKWNIFCPKLSYENVLILARRWNVQLNILRPCIEIEQFRYGFVCTEYVPQMLCCVNTAKLYKFKKVTIIPIPKYGTTIKFVLLLLKSIMLGIG